MAGIWPWVWREGEDTYRNLLYNWRGQAQVSLGVVGVVGRLALSGGASQAQLQSSSPSCHETLMKTWSGANIVPLADTLERRWIILFAIDIKF